jgi:hypothetical protein
MAGEDSELRRDRCFVDFLLHLILKSIFATQDRTLGPNFPKFLLAFSKRLGSIKSHAVKFSHAYARFVNLLFDMKYYAHAVQAIKSQTIAFMAAQNPALEDFLGQVFRPKLFYIAVLNSDNLRPILEILQKLVDPGMRGVFYVFSVLLRTFWRLPDALRHRLVNHTLHFISQMSPLDKLAVKTAEAHPAYLFYAFYLSQLEEQGAIDWWMATDGAAHSAIFQSIHFMLDQLQFTGKAAGFDKGKEMCFAVHASVLSFIRVIYGDLEVKQEVTEVMYHFLCVNVCVDEYLTIVNVLSEILELDILYMMNHSRPPLPKFITRLLKRSSRSPHISTFFKTLFACDISEHGEIERSMSLCCRALSTLSHAELQSIKLMTDAETVAQLVEFINSLVKVGDQLARPNLSIEDSMTWMLARIETLKPSPDAFLVEVENLGDFLRKNDYFEEEFQTRILIIAVIAEYLTVQRRIKQYWGELHASKVFGTICSSVPLAIYPGDVAPTINCYCDTQYFSFFSLTVLMKNLLQYSIEARKGFEQVFELVDIMWPIYEQERYLKANFMFFSLEMAVARNRADIPADTDRLFGHYFRVAFFGAQFDWRNGKTVIYREKNLTHLYELTTRLQNEFKALFGTPIELIKESGKIDPGGLDPKLNYVQLTFMEPYFPKKEQWTKVSSYDLMHRIKTFYFDTPFTKGSDQAQGSLDQQWIRRTLMTVERTMPSIVKFAEVLPENINEREFMPVRVTYRMLSDRVKMLETPIAAVDYRQIQQLLHGSLLVQGNEGPSKMAEVFLSGGDVDARYAEKLRNTFRQFLAVNKQGLRTHAKWVNENIAFRPLQEELESGYANLADKLSQYLGDPK